MPLFLQTLLGYTAMLSGLVLSPGGLAVCVCMPVVGLLLRKYEARWLVVFGVLVSAAGLLMMSRFNLDVDYGTAVRARVVQSFGLGFLFVPISAAAFARVPKERTNYATGLFNLARNIGGSSGIAAITTMLARRAQVHQQTLVAHLTPYDPFYRASLANTAAMVATRGPGLAGAEAQARGLIYGGMLRQANMLSFADAFLAMAVLFLAIVPLMFFMRKAGPVKGPVMVE
jgi:DHA2 family multidrug resistance protein